VRFLTMGFITPAALGLFLLAIPIIIFYMLRLKRQPMKVSSLLLWQRVLQDQQANAPWQKLRRNLLLLLQLLLLALIALALARPYRLVEAKVQGNVIILLDASASMQATDILPSRFEAAKAEALALIRALTPDDTVSLILAADTATPLLTAKAGNDRVALEKAIADAQVTNAAANWEPALALAAAGAASQANTTIAILSDGAIPADLPALPAPARWIPIGSGMDNQAIVALAARDGRSGPELFIRVMNFSDQSASRLLEIKVDDRLFDARDLNLPPYPKGNAGLTIALPADARRVEARLGGSDFLLPDDAAQTQLSGLQGRVLLNGPGNLFLERAFSLLPGISVFQASGEAFKLPPVNGGIEGGDNAPSAAGSYDLTIFDRTIPDTLPDGNLIFIAPPQSTPLFEVKGVFSNTRQIALSAEHPILNYVNFANLHVAQAQKVQAPAWAKTLLNSQGGPLLIAGEKSGRRAAIITFDLLKSDLPLQIDFPILIANLSRWLLAQPLIIEEETASSQSANPLNAAESNIRPEQNQIFGTEQSAAQHNGLQGRQEFWPLLVALALLVLFWEWWVYWQGGGA